MFDQLTRTEQDILRQKFLRGVYASAKLAGFCVDDAALWNRAYGTQVECSGLHADLCRQSIAADQAAMARTA